MDDAVDKADRVTLSVRNTPGAIVTDFANEIANNFAKLSTMYAADGQCDAAGSVDCDDYSAINGNPGGGNTGNYTNTGLASDVGLSQAAPLTKNEAYNHVIVHDDCVPGPRDAKKPQGLVATIFYRGIDNRAKPHDATTSPATSRTILDAMQDNMACYTSQNELERLDDAHGHYVSDTCLAGFLHLMSHFPALALTDLGTGALPGPSLSSHRCLDSRHRPRVVEVLLRPTPIRGDGMLQQLRRHEHIKVFEYQWNVDICFQADTLERRHPRLVVFDMDGTLIRQEVIDLLAESMDRPEIATAIAGITARAMRGELDFEAAFRERLRLLAGVPLQNLMDLTSRIGLAPSVKPMLRAFRKLGIKTAVVSGGFQPLTQWLANQLSLDHAHANVVEIDTETNCLTGEIHEEIVSPQRKASLLQTIAANEGIGLEQTVAVGDGANDLVMMEVAGLGVAWNAKPIVQAKADARLNVWNMTDLLYLFGYDKSEIDHLGR